jgi:putative sigma-54 modulation protein
MQIVVSAKNFQLSPSLREYAEKKLGAIKKYFDHIIEVDAVLSVKEAKDQTRSRMCEVTVLANGVPFNAKQASEDLYASIDMVADKIERQVKKFKEKQLDRRQHNRPDKTAIHKVLSFASDANAEPTPKGSERVSQIVRSGTFSMKPMFVDEAAEQLDMLRQEFFVFSNAETNRVNVIYKRTDGNIGLIEPEA